MNNNKKDLFFEILRFLIVGGLSTLVDYAVFYFCNKIVFSSVDFNVNLFFSTALGFISGFFVNWFLQRFVFTHVTKDDQRDKVVFIKFTVVSLIGLGLTELGMFLASPTFEVYDMTIFGVTFDFWKLFFKVMMTIIVLIWNYLARKFFVFRKKEIVDSEEESDD